MSGFTSEEFGRLYVVECERLKREIEKLIEKNLRKCREEFERSG